MVPPVPVCMYAHVREGDMHIAERVKKKTGTKWDRDQLGCARVAGWGVSKEVPTAKPFSSIAHAKNQRISGLLWPFLGNPKKDR